jgi:hypothetical protein
MYQLCPIYGNRVLYISSDLFKSAFFGVFVKCAMPSVSFRNCVTVSQSMPNIFRLRVEGASNGRGDTRRYVQMNKAQQLAGSECAASGDRMGGLRHIRGAANVPLFDR